MFQMLCTNEWKEHPDKHILTGPVHFRSWKQPANNLMYTSSYTRVTCPDCIKLLLPKVQKQLDHMNSAIKQIEGGPSGGG